MIENVKQLIYPDHITLFLFPVLTDASLIFYGSWFISADLMEVHGVFWSLIDPVAHFMTQQHF